ncbi:unnamed protein product [Pleuronectes platessa]|uniref:Uncharacterized protein n=1 Tax=Pleuronectes platessa TaxID=8262 RepID=A0A9N7YS23_PLEPL|nr:unnamed protein product [Pleuronectes platessa]
MSQIPKDAEQVPKDESKVSNEIQIQEIQTPMEIQTSANGMSWQPLKKLCRLMRACPFQYAISSPRTTSKRRHPCLSPVVRITVRARQVGFPRTLPDRASPTAYSCAVDASLETERPLRSLECHLWPNVYAGNNT